MALYAMPVEYSDDCVAFPWTARFSPAQRTYLGTLAGGKKRLQEKMERSLQDMKDAAAAAASSSKCD